jgi:hypothetical protein
MRSWVTIPPLVFAIGRSKVRQLGSAPQTSDECVRLLLEAGASVDEPNALGGTPLFIASKHRRQTCIELLLSRRANPCLAERDNMTPLYSACFSGESRRHIACVMALCEGMTDSEFVECIAIREVQSGMTALHAAAEQRDGEASSIPLAGRAVLAEGQFLLLQFLLLSLFDTAYGHKVHDLNCNGCVLARCAACRPARARSP